MINAIIFTAVLLLSALLLFLFYPKMKRRISLLFAVREERCRVLMEDLLKRLLIEESRAVQMTVPQLLSQPSLSNNKRRLVLGKMKKCGYLSINGDFVQLTEVGRSAAFKLVRAHRLYERYLAERTGYDPTEWHLLAEKAEHHLQEEQLTEMVKQMGHHSFDPHGDPIPRVEGDPLQTESVPLTRWPEGMVGRIVHLEDEPSAYYREIVSKGIHLGAVVRLITRQEDQVRFSSENELITVSSDVAGNIYLKEVPSDALAAQPMVRRLSQLALGEKALIVGLSEELHGANRRRLLDLGFVKGSEVQVALISPMSNPKAYRVRDTLIALRDDQANKILVKIVSHE